MQENRDVVVYGAQCSWIGALADAGAIPMEHGDSMPCCPHCQGPLFEISRAQWDSTLAERDARTPGYRDLIAWMWGRCYPSFSIAQSAYSIAKTMESGQPAANQGEPK